MYVQELKFYQFVVKTLILLAKIDQKMIKNMSLYKYFYYIFKTIFKIIK